ncbi:hypothetical protein IRP63_14885 (plasmid) [Clostridium botulinum]|nr:hypothetical protein [Clostridium botulinum]MCD3232658.1 hypothetical protein [Clostridium botulinum D/C]MCD3238413.1 hypothetical protein [Clostridium botulinum D/C]MCD3266067.1 hypothetical protein [Clostridium botulinum D/C]MCD3301144.1 hypothetical protein [Clostridium botulinum D/C]MCD3304306.1 hypothetical protein [Clostridium botulinum D/C]
MKTKNLYSPVVGVTTTTKNFKNGILKNRRINVGIRYTTMIYNSDISLISVKVQSCKV